MNDKTKAQAGVIGKKAFSMFLWVVLFVVWIILKTTFIILKEVLDSLHRYLFKRD